MTRFTKGNRSASFKPSMAKSNTSPGVEDDWRNKEEGNPSRVVETSEEGLRARTLPIPNPHHDQTQILMDQVV